MSIVLAVFSFIFSPFKFIFTFATPFIVQYGEMALSIILGLNKKQIIYLSIALLLAGENFYVYNLGVNNCKLSIERKAQENAKKKQKLRNTAIDDDTTIEWLLDGK